MQAIVLDSPVVGVEIIRVGAGATKAARAITAGGVDDVGGISEGKVVVADRNDLPGIAPHGGAGDDDGVRGFAPSGGAAQLNFASARW